MPGYSHIYTFEYAQLQVRSDPKTKMLGDNMVKAVVHPDCRRTRFLLSVA